MAQSLGGISSNGSSSKYLESGSDDVLETPASFTTHYDIGTSIENIDTWPAKKQGYRDLCGFCIFVLWYIVVLALQLQVGNSYKINTAMSSAMASTVSNVAGQGDFWNLLVMTDNQGNVTGGILPILFQSQWYNGDAYSTDEEGYILDYNKLVGGVLITQTRGVVQNDGCASILGNSSYSDFYANCYTSDIDTNPFNSTNDPITNSAFMYNDTRGGYAAFFGVAEGRDRNIKKALLLNQYRWTDKATRHISIKFAFYNGNVGLFSFCAIDFIYNLGGMFANGNHLQIQSLNMEPYRNTQDFIRLFMEVVFMIMLSQQIVLFLKTSYNAMQEVDEERGSRKGFRALINLWTMVDATNLSLFVAYIGFRCNVLWIIYTKPISVPSNEYQTVLEIVSLVQNSQLVVNFLNLFIALLRFFKFYQFQAKLNVVNKTFENAFTDLYHFLIMFSVIFGGYGVMGHFLFGPHVYDYSGLGRALNTCWQTLLGNFNVDEITAVNQDMAAVYFISFMSLIVIVLVNILLAILIDAYTRATQDQEGMTIMSEIGKGVIHGVNALRGHYREVKDDDIVQALEILQSSGCSRATPQEIGATIAKQLRRREYGNIVEVVSEHPFLQVLELTEEKQTDEEINLISGYPLELIDNIESVLRENSYLRQRVKLREMNLKAAQQQQKRQ